MVLYSPARSLSPFSEILAQSRAAHKAPRKRTPVSRRVIDSEDEDSDQDPSPHAQPPASTPSISSPLIEPNRKSHSPAQDSRDNDQRSIQKTSEATAVGGKPAQEDEEARDPHHEEGNDRPLVPTQDTTEIDPAECDFQSDADIDESLARLAENYSKMDAAQKRSWESNRALDNFRNGRPKHFECLVHLLGDSPCSTRQEYYPSKVGARSAISGFFGHNKNEWNQVPKAVRVFLCRKDYQRHQHKLKNGMGYFHLPLCRELVNRLEQWRPGNRFTVQLTKTMSERLTKFYEEVHAGLSEAEAAAKTDAIKTEGTTTDAVRKAEKTPVIFAIELQNRFRGDKKTPDDVRALLDWLETKLADGTIKDFPAFEALFEALPQDVKRMQDEQKRRRALENEKLPEAVKLAKKRNTHTKAAAASSSASVQATEREPSPTAGPSQAAATTGYAVASSPTGVEGTKRGKSPMPDPSKTARTAMPPPSFTFTPINTDTASYSGSNITSTPQFENLWETALKCDRENEAREKVQNGQSDEDEDQEMESDIEMTNANNGFAVTKTHASPSKITLRLGKANKGKAPVRAGFVPSEPEALVPKKRKHAATPVRRDSKLEGEQTRPAKKSKQTTPVDEPSVVATLSISDMKVVIDFAPAT